MTLEELTAETAGVVHDLNEKLHEALNKNRPGDAADYATALRDAAGCVRRAHQRRRMTSAGVHFDRVLDIAHATRCTTQWGKRPYGHAWVRITHSNGEQVEAHGDTLEEAALELLGGIAPDPPAA